MDSVVKELQKELLAKDCDITSSLRKAHFIAKYLKLLNDDKWIMDELQGYENYNDIPEYRTIHAEIKAYNKYNGWIPVIFTNQKIHDAFSIKKLFDPVSSLIEFTKTKDKIKLELSDLEISMLRKFTKGNVFELNFDYTQIIGIIDNVKNKLLDWTFSLENNNLGLDYNFKDDEVNAAKSLDKTVINNYGNFFNQSKIENTSISNTNNFYYDNIILGLKDALNSVQKEVIDADDLRYIKEELEKTENMCKSKNKKEIIKNVLKGIYDYCISVGASITASVIQKLMM